MDPPRLIINTSAADAYKPITEVHQPIENIELKQMGDASEGPHHHTVEISVERKKPYTSRILVSVCLVTLVVGGALITSVRDWNHIELGGWNMVNRNWGASVSIDPWEDDYNDSDLMSAQVGKAWRIPYRTPTLFVKRETIYDKILPSSHSNEKYLGLHLCLQNQLL